MLCVTAIKGFIRSPFVMSCGYNGVSSYGLGSITDGEFKISIQIKNFKESAFQKGDPVTVRGTVERKGNYH